jgi:hypothetical protein
VTFTTPRVVAIAALAALGGVGAAAATFPTAPPPVVQRAQAPATPVEVRTETIHRTIHVIRHERAHVRRRRPPAVVAPPPAPAPRIAVAAPAAPVTRAVRPLRSRTSGSSGHGGEREHEGGEHERGDD